MRASTYERDSVRWKRCRRPRNMTKELGGKERAATSQRGPSKAPPAGHWQRKPPSGPLAQVPPLRQTPGTQRPASVSSSQSSPRGQVGGRGGVILRPAPGSSGPRPSEGLDLQVRAKKWKSIAGCGHAPIIPDPALSPLPATPLPRTTPLLFLCPVKPLVAQWCLTLCDPSLPGSSVHGISQARILEWLAIPFSRGSSPPRSPALQANCLPSEPSRGWPSQDLYFFQALVSLSARSYRFWTNRAQLAPGGLKTDAQCSLAL